MPIAVALLSVAAIAMLLVALRQSPAAAERLIGVMHSGGLVLPESSLGESLSTSMLRRLSEAASANTQAILTQLTPSHWLAAARLKMQRLGDDSSRCVAAYLLCWIILILTAVICAVLALFVQGASPLARAGLLVGVAAVTILLPTNCLDGQVRRRQEEIRLALPDVTDLLVVSAEAGLGIEGAIATVVRRKPGPLSDEFARMLLEIRLGGDRQAAWKDLVERVGVTELQALVGSLHDAEQTGVSIASTLRAQSDAMRAQRSLRVRQLAATLPIKMLFPLIFFILPALFVVVIGPGGISLYKALVYLD